MVPSANNTTQVILDTLTELTDFPAADKYFIAYSGGLDSTALLYALSKMPELTGKLTAIHVNHNIHPDSYLWADHCAEFCNQLNIPFIPASVQPKDHSEAACRSSRQQVFQQHLKAGDCLLTGHHLNDQIETVLFRLMRGSGLQGMTGIDRSTTFEYYLVYRPLLALSQAHVKEYADRNNLKHIEDPSNNNNQYSRNHIRNLIVPELEQYEPKVLFNIGATLNNLKHSQELLSSLIGNSNPFDFQSFNSKELLSSALYHWLLNLNQQAPNQKRLNQFSHDCINAAADKNPELQFEYYRLIRWNKLIYAVPSQYALDQSEFSIQLSSNEPSTTLPNNGQLTLSADHPLSLSASIKYQQSHERIKLNKNGQHKKLNNLFQQLNIPPWERKKLPYLYIDNELMAVGTEIISVQFKQLLNQYKAEYRWLSLPHLL